MFEKHSGKSERYFLETLWWGLEHVYNKVRRLERKREREERERQRQSGGTGLIVFSAAFGNEPKDPLIFNCFIWYASAAACYLQLLDHAFSLHRAYQKSFASMLKWRNKVAAHTAHVVPRPDDSKMSQAVSIMMHPEWDSGRYAVGGFILSDAGSRSHDDWYWSLTRTHEAIRKCTKSNI